MASLFKGTENIKKISVDDVKKTDPKSIKEDQQIDLYTDQREQKKGTISNNEFVQLFAQRRWTTGTKRN